MQNSYTALGSAVVDGHQASRGGGGEEFEYAARMPNNKIAASQQAIRVVIADDHQLLRQAYNALLARSGGFLVVGEARDGIQAIEMSVSNSPDIVLMDIQMPRMNGLRAIEEIRRRASQARILVISMMTEPGIIREALTNGAHGFISKDDSFDELVTAIRSIRQGQLYLGKQVQSALVG